MKLNLDLVLVIFLANIIITTDALYGKQHMKTRTHRKLINVLADNFVAYFDLENKLLADNYFKQSGPVELSDCDNLDNISNYFLDVYSESNNKTMTVDDLENLISYQINKKHKHSETKDKSDKIKCKRRKVLF